MNKMQMYLRLNERIYTGFGTELLMIDSPFENKDFAPYVVFELVRKTPMKEIPQKVLERLASEISNELDNPSLGSKLLYAIIKFYESFRLNKTLINYKRSNVHSIDKNRSKSKR